MGCWKTGCGEASDVPRAIVMMAFMAKIRSAHTDTRPHRPLPPRSLSSLPSAGMPVVLPDVALPSPALFDAILSTSSVEMSTPIDPLLATLVRRDCAPGGGVGRGSRRTRTRGGETCGSVSFDSCWAGGMGGADAGELVSLARETVGDAPGDAAAKSTSVPPVSLSSIVPCRISPFCSNTLACVPHSTSRGPFPPARFRHCWTPGSLPFCVCGVGPARTSGLVSCEQS